MSTILIFGSGAREHAIAWKCRREGYRVVVAPGNAGIGADAELRAVTLADLEACVALARELSPVLAIVGPEQPLVDGLADQLRDAGVTTFGPSRAAAELEGSKAAAKTFMASHGIPTAQHVTVSTLDEGIAALANFSTPPVVKASGLAAGKGVVVAESFDEAKAALTDCMQAAKFGEAGRTVVLEERLHGQEVSFFSVCDGQRARHFMPCQDHKRLRDGDEGPNTGGMGAYGPAPVCNDEVREKIVKQVVQPTLAGLAAEGRPFCGVLFCGLMIDAAGDPKLIEYNVRFGDPEAQPLLYSMKGELVPILLAAAGGRLESDGDIAGTAAATVVLASAGYPESSTKGSPIGGLSAAESLAGVKVFHAATGRGPAGEWVSAGGRVLGVCARGDSIAAALAAAYAGLERIEMPGGQFRRDIGAKASSVGDSPV